MANETLNLARFVFAMTNDYDEVWAELRAAFNRTHWMWFVFPQLRGPVLWPRRRSRSGTELAPPPGRMRSICPWARSAWSGMDLAGGQRAACFAADDGLAALPSWLELPKAMRVADGRVALNPQPV